jgi:AraC-like DNA-binding protein
MPNQFANLLEKFVGVEKPPTLVVSAFAAAEFVASRVQWAWSAGGHPTQFDRADGYLVCLQRKDMLAQAYWVDQRPALLDVMHTGQFLLLDLNVQHSSIVPCDVDCISIYVSRSVLHRFQTEHGMRPCELRAPPGVAHDDLVVRHLGEALLPAILQPHLARQLYVDHVALALLSRLTSAYGLESPPAFKPAGGLAPWQERRAKEMLISHLDDGIGLAQLAVECRLSRSHFARAFKVTTGVSPLRWLTQQRVERSKVFLATTQLPLEQIAVMCGFTDASHLTRVFQTCVGVPPGAWRRALRS